MLVENLFQTSFFDDDEPYSQFDFTAPKQKHAAILTMKPFLREEATCINLSTGMVNAGTFSLQKQYLIFKRVNVTGKQTSYFFLERTTR